MNPLINKLRALASKQLDFFGLLILFALLCITASCSQAPTQSQILPERTIAEPLDDFEENPVPADLQLQNNQIYHSVEIDLSGPVSVGMGTPNPFLIEVEVTFTGPQG